MSEGRDHGAELENWRGALQDGSEEGQKKKREEKEKKQKGKSSCEVYITEHSTVFLMRATVTFGTDRSFFISPPSTYQHTL